MAAEQSTEPVKLQPNSSCSSRPRANMEMPEEKMVITAKLQALSARVFSSNRILRYSGTERARLP